MSLAELGNVLETEECKDKPSSSHRPARNASPYIVQEQCNQGPYNHYKNNLKKNISSKRLMNKESIHMKSKATLMSRPSTYNDIEAFKAEM